jgi:hypothetical protein
MERLTTMIVLMVISCVPFAACGSDNGGSGSSDGGSSPESPQARASAADKAKFLACLKQAGIRVIPSGNVNVTVQGRVPRVPVPAEYVGAAVLPSGGFYDLWLAGDPDSAAAAAEELNATLSQKLGSEVRGAVARGPVVSAVGGNVQVNSISEAREINRCKDRL